MACVEIKKCGEELWRILVVGEDIYGDGRFNSAIVLFEADDVAKVEAFLAVIKAAEDLAL